MKNFLLNQILQNWKETKSDYRAKPRFVQQ